MRILAFCDRYLPGSKGGGAIRSVSNLVAALPEFEFSVVTRDRDFTETSPYEGVRFGEWNEVGGAQVRYLRPGEGSATLLEGLVGEVRPDVLYFNSFFSPEFTLRPLWLCRRGRLGTVRTVVAPRGEFSPGALQIKAAKKRLFLAAARGARLYDGVVWQASTEHEAEELRAWTGPEAEIVVAPNVPSAFEGPEPVTRNKRSGELKLVFVSRVSRKKNLDGAIRMLRSVRGRVIFDIYGPLEDPAYWEECLRETRDLPESIEVRHRGSLPHEQVFGALQAYDAFFMPTHGENFGHAILEAMAAGLPVVISDKTAWRGLEAAGAGWDLPLSDEAAFTRVVQGLVEMGSEAHAVLGAGARALAEGFGADGSIVDANRRLFLGR
ncbi:MAG: glycosyltransferase family 4 protein [Fimbriimonadaceae bacterium]|nr:glycosyltransferase family 4 protein [Fimbriimonadaceae bacterium]